LLMAYARLYRGY